MASSHKKDEKNEKDLSKGNVSMIHMQMSPNDGYARLEKDGKQALLRESRQAGMLSIDYKGTPITDAKRIAELKAGIKHAQDKKHQIEKTHVANRTPKQISDLNRYSETIKTSEFLLKGYHSSRYAVVDNAWIVVKNEHIAAAKAGMQDFKSLSSEEQKQYVESLFKLLLEDKFTPEVMRQPPEGEASKLDMYKQIKGDNYQSFSNQVIPKANESSASSPHSMFNASVAQRNAPPPPSSTASVDPLPTAPGGPGKSKKS